jgi:outer membrane receptor protein involved in Fe transport
VLSPTALVDNTASNDEFDLFGGWHFTDKISARVGIMNLANEAPPLVGVGPGNDEAGVTDPTGVYDELGRRFYVGVTGKF